MPIDFDAATSDAPREIPHLGPGRPVLAFDVGGTDIKSAIVDENGRIADLCRTPTPRGGSDPAGAVVASLATLARELTERHTGITPVAAGVSVPGLVDETVGTGLYSATLGWRDAAIRDRARDALQLPIAFGHDVRAAGTAEHRMGAAAALTDVMVVVVGTSIASALILDGKPYVGGGYAGELGHSLSVPNGELCRCGARGCLETVASAGAISRRYSEATGRHTVGARAVTRAAAQGDAAAEKIWEEAITALAEALARATAIVAPQAIILGGGLAEAGYALFEPLDSRLNSLMRVSRRPALLPARLGQNAGLIGTAIAAREHTRPDDTDLSRKTNRSGAS